MAGEKRTVGVGASMTRRQLLRRSALALPAVGLVLGAESPLIRSVAAAQTDAFGVAPPDVSAQAVYAIDSASGAVLYAKNATAQRPVASITKCVTALTVVQAVNAGTITLNDMVAIEDDDMAQSGYSSMGARVGDQLSVTSLLDGLLIPSGGDAANALSRYVGAKLSKQSDADTSRAAFVAAMNDYVTKTLKLKNTNFTDAAGDDDNSGYSTAVDLMEIGKAVMADPNLSWIVGQKHVDVPSTNGASYSLDTTNDLIGVSGIVGIKTGSTDGAGACLLSARSVNNGQSTVIMVVLGSSLKYDDQGYIVESSDGRFKDTTAIINDMDARFTWHSIDDAESMFPDLKGELAAWGVEFQNPPTIPLATGAKTKPTAQLVLGKPVDAGKQAGSVDFYSGDNITGSIPVYQIG